MSVHVEHHDHVAVVSLARPPANAMTTASLNEVAEAFEHLAVDDRAAAIVLTGEGRSFSAGLDLREIRDDPGDQEALIEALNRAFLAMYSCPKLVVAAVNGHAIAGGLILALCADIRLAADTGFKAGLAEVRVGVVYPVGALEVVRCELAPHVARRLVLTGENVDAATAVALGVFDRLVDADALAPTAISLAATHPPPIGFARIKAQLRSDAVTRMRAVIGGNDPLPRPWLTDETFSAAAAALR